MSSPRTCYLRALAQILNNGIPLRDQLQGIRSRAGVTPIAVELTHLVRLLYADPQFSKLTPEGARSAFLVDCQARVLKGKAGGRTYTDPLEIQHAIGEFRTFDGRSLSSLLSEYGLKVQSVETVPASFSPRDGDQPGDLLYTITFAHGPTKSMPCRLRAWFGGPTLPIAELVRRGSTFPLVQPDTDDPFIYWAATGKCSTAYSY